MSEVLGWVIGFLFLHTRIQAPVSRSLGTCTDAVSMPVSELRNHDLTYFPKFNCPSLLAALG